MGLYNDQILPHLINRVMRHQRHEPYRRRLMALARGRVLEVGIGSGLNLRFYTERATGVVGIDPNPKLRAMASRRSLVVPSQIMGGRAEAIPLDDRSVDTVVSTWVLCSLPDVAAALREMRRVLRKDGQFLFVEHGLAPEKGVQRWQHGMTPAWKHVSGGCHLNRNITALVRDAGFHIACLETGYMPGPKPMTFTYEGVARPG
jgi:ubiquinone/menaquinone biosynthesis C-methylase UbiE